MRYLSDFNNKKSKERKVINTMIRIYCRGNCKSKDICPNCKELMDYVYMKIDKCPFSDTKIYCNNCKVHCYREDMAVRIKKVMRYSGPRLIIYHPIMAIDHMIEDILYKKNLRRGKDIC